MTIDEALNEGASLFLCEKRSRHIAELLMSCVLGKAKEWVIAHGDEDLDSDLCEKFFDFVRQVVNGKPLEYITNVKEFYGLDFYVDERVLIPRPETEMLVDEVLKIVQENYTDDVRILDVGTGSGNIAVSLAKHLKQAQIVACDVSENVIDVVRINIAKHGMEKSIKVVHSDLLSELSDESFDIIVANLPYIGLTKYNFVSKEAKENEPNVALFGGFDGLQLYKKMFQQLSELNVGYSFVLGEFGFLQSEDMCELLSQFFDQKFVIKPDLAGIDRIFVVNSFRC